MIFHWFSVAPGRPKPGQQANGKQGRLIESRMSALINSMPILFDFCQALNPLEASMIVWCMSALINLMPVLCDFCQALNLLEASMTCVSMPMTLINLLCFLSNFIEKELALHQVVDYFLISPSILICYGCPPLASLAPVFR